MSRGPQWWLHLRLRLQQAHGHCAHGVHALNLQLRRQQHLVHLQDKNLQGTRVCVWCGGGEGAKGIGQKGPTPPTGLTKHWSPWGLSALSSWQDCSKKWSQKWARRGGPPRGSGVGLKCWYSRKVSITDTRYLRAQRCLQFSQAPASTARERGLNGGIRCHGHWFGRDQVLGSGLRPVDIDTGAENTRLKRRPLTIWGH